MDAYALFLSYLLSGRLNSFSVFTAGDLFSLVRGRFSYIFSYSPLPSYLPSSPCPFSLTIIPNLQHTYTLLTISPDFNVDEPGEQNQLMLQAFEWYVPDDQQHWRRLQAALPSLKAIGVTSIWLPPGCKAMSPSGNGYDIYDLYDLGEFYQKGSRATKWGTKEELVSLVNKAHELEIGVIWDTVLNHKAAADHTERCVAVKVDPKGGFLSV